MNLFQLMQTHPIVNCILHQSFTVNYRSDTVDSIKAFYNVFQFFAMQLFPYIKTQSKIISASCIQLEQASNPPPPIVMARYIVSIYRHILIILSTSRAHTLSLSLSHIIFLSFSLYLSFNLFCIIDRNFAIYQSSSFGKISNFDFQSKLPKVFRNIWQSEIFFKKRMGQTRSLLFILVLFI